MSGTVPKIKIETDQGYNPISIKNPLNIEGITLTHDDSDDSLSTVEQDDSKNAKFSSKSAMLSRPTVSSDTPKVHKSNKFNKSARFAADDYKNFINSSKTKSGERYESDSENNSETDESGSSECSDYSESDVSSEEEKSSDKKNKKEEKQTLLLKLYALEKKGVELSRKFSMNSKLSELKFEYELHRTSTETEMSIKFQQKILIAAITGLEFVNKKFDPVGAKLDGWSESVMDNLDDYDSVFAKLHEKYKERADLPPEIQLLVTLAGSAFMFHMTKSMFSGIMSATENPKTADIIKNMSYQNINLNLNKNAASADMSGPSSNFSNLLNDDETMSSGSVETSKEVTVNQKGKRAINL
jgi:hypothetical protein